MNTITEEYGLPKVFATWRDGQKEVVDRLVNIYQKGMAGVILEAPTGCGKSAIAIAVANKLEKKFWYVTNTIQLQEQVEFDFGLNRISGRRNYKCAKFHGVDASACPYTSTSEECPCKALCDYLIKRNEAIESGKVVFNYPYFLNVMNFTTLFDGNSTFTIFDECHSIERQLMNFISGKFSLFDFSMMREEFPVEEDIGQTIKSITKGYDRVSQEYEELMCDIELEMNTMTPESLGVAMEKANKYLALKRKIEFVMEYYDESWVFSHYYEKQDVKNSSISLKPTTVDKFMKNMFHSDFVLFMSATVGDKNIYCRNLGMKSSLIPLIKVPSTFDKNRRPIVYEPACRMSKDKIDEQKLIQKIDEIIERELPLGKGLIHTNSYEIASIISMKTIYNHEIMRHSSDNRSEVLERFRYDDRKVLVSPSMEEGIDLKYDELNWQIIVKVPFLFLGDKQIKKRLEMDRNWYTQETINTLVQTYGRGMRAEDDYCLTYIIDENFPWLVKRYERMFPDWFLEAITMQRPNIEEIIR